MTAAGEAPGLTPVAGMRRAVSGYWSSSPSCQVGRRVPMIRDDPAVTAEDAAAPEQAVSTGQEACGG